MGLLETQSLPGIQYPTMPLRLDIDCNNVYQNATQCHLCWEGCEGVHPCLYQCLLIGWPSSNNINSSLLHPLKRLRHGFPLWRNDSGLWTDKIRNQVDKFRNCKVQTIEYSPIFGCRLYQRLEEKYPYYP